MLQRLCKVKNKPTKVVEQPAKETGAAEVCTGSQKTKTRDPASNWKGGVGPPRKQESALKSFLLLSFKIE